MSGSYVYSVVQIVTNKAVTPNKKYVLYQRGCPEPDVADADASFAIPLRSVALSSSTYFPVMHYMGEKPAFRFYTSGRTYSGNACIHKQVRVRECVTCILSPALWAATRSADFRLRT